MSEETEAPIQAPLHVNPPDNEDLKKLWQEYLQKACECGQIWFQLEQIDGQKRQMEKQLEVTQQAVKKAATKHRELQAELARAAKPKATAAASEQITSEPAH